MQTYKILLLSVLIALAGCWWYHNFYALEVCEYNKYTDEWCRIYSYGNRLWFSCSNFRCLYETKTFEEYRKELKDKGMWEKMFTQSD